MAMGQQPKAEVDWQRLDKTKFFVVGGFLFTGLTTALFPLTVIKTRQMALEGAPRGVKGAYLTAQAILQHDGVRGLYKGYGTVVAGAIPARILYLSTLEAMKAATSKLLQQYQLGDTASTGLSSFVGGGLASLVSQTVVVPVDVISQRLMIMGGGAPAAPAAAGGVPAAAAAAAVQRVNGLQLARQILAKEGVGGFYRGFWASAALFAPNSAIWWGCYGTYQRIFWRQIDSWRGEHRRTEREMLGVEAAAGIVTGFTSGALTNPLDVVKTRLQTRDLPEGVPKPTFTSVVRQLMRDEGLRGFYRGVQPRMFNSAIWGTTMVTTYEFLKRLCVLPPEKKDA